MCEYLYRIRKVRFDKGEYPQNGFVRIVKCNYSSKYCEIIAYNRKLSKKEATTYAMDFIGTIY